MLLFLIDQHTRAHSNTCKSNYTLWQCWQANILNFVFLEKAHHHINGWTNKICHILLGSKFPLLSFQMERKEFQRKKISVFHYVFFFLILFKFTIQCYTVIYPRQVLNINQVFLLWNMIICKLTIIGTEKMWAAKWPYVH